MLVKPAGGTDFLWGGVRTPHAVADGSTACMMARGARLAVEGVERGPRRGVGPGRGPIRATPIELHALGTDTVRRDGWVS